MAIERNKDERETHICMSGNSKKMQIFTTEYHIMRRLDKYVEESEAWKVIEVGKVNGKVVSKIYEAPRELLSMKKKKRVMTEEQRRQAAERLAAYRQKKAGDTATASGVEPDKNMRRKILVWSWKRMKKKKQKMFPAWMRIPEQKLLLTRAGSHQGFIQKNQNQRL